MGCTVSFIFCEEDLLQMPICINEEEEEEKEETTTKKKKKVKEKRSPKKVRRTSERGKCGQGVGVKRSCRL